ncbi:hypothetical protein ACLOJK_002021 [Asimina triloba]
MHRMYKNQKPIFSIFVRQPWLPNPPPTATICPIFQQPSSTPMAAPALPPMASSISFITNDHRFKQLSILFHVLANPPLPFQVLDLARPAAPITSSPSAAQLATTHLQRRQQSRPITRSPPLLHHPLVASIITIQRPASRPCRIHQQASHSPLHHRPRVDGHSSSQLPIFH